jgi:hypothetical protein
MSQTFAKLSAAVRALLPKTVEEAKSALAALVRDIDKAKTYEGLRTMERRADAIKAFYSHIDEVKHEAERAVLLVRHRAPVKCCGTSRRRPERAEWVGQV